MALKSLRIIYPAALLFSVFWSLGSCFVQEGTDLQKERAESLGILRSRPETVKTVGRGQFGTVTHGFMDSSGNLWFSTSGDGLYRYKPGPEEAGLDSFVHFTTRDGLNSNAVYCVIEDQSGNLLFGTGRGICRYDPSADPSIPGTKMTERGKIFIDITENTPISSSNISLLFEDSKGRLWACNYQNGSYEKGVYLYDPTREISRAESFEDFLAIETVRNDDNLRLLRTNAIVEDAVGNIWFAGQNYDNLSRYDGKNLVQHKFAGPVGENWMVYRSMIQDKKGQYWMGSHSYGVIKYVPGENRKSEKLANAGVASFVHFSEDSGQRHSPYMAILEDSQGYIWFCNDSEGVWRYNPNAQGECEFVFENIDIPNKHVFSAVEDGDGNIWFGTRETGLYRFDGETFVKFSG